MQIVTPIASLRERKKAQTRAALAEASFDLVRDHGATALTAEAIAERAGVSRRTFFNYFPSVDAAVAYSVAGLLQDLTDALGARPAEENVWDTLPALLTGPEGTRILERMALLGATRESSPQARRIAQDQVDAFVEWLTGWVTHRLAGRRAAATSEGPMADRRAPGTSVVADEELYAATLAASVAACAEASLRVWARRNAGTVSAAAIDDYHHLLSSSLELLRTGFYRTTEHI